eukprot:80937-Prymnesium_polylepis.1
MAPPAPPARAPSSVDLIEGDALRHVLHLLDLRSLRVAKCVSRSWRAVGRRVLCSPAWQDEHWEHRTEATVTSTFGATVFVAHRRYTRLSNPHSVRQGVAVRATDMAGELARQSRGCSAPVVIKKLTDALAPPALAAENYARAAKRLLLELRLLRHFSGHANL